MSEYDIGIVGLGTMGLNLLLNMVDHGHSVAGYARRPEQAQELSSRGLGAKGFSDIAQFVAAIRRPRAILLLVPAGTPVDEMIDALAPYLTAGDLLIDAGNSYYRDTERRISALAPRGLAFIGMGVSGGEEGARHGPSIMPGGTPEHYDRIRPILESIAAQYEGQPCVALCGSGSAGHYVKMVHNGIEYGIMQLIAETYDLMRRGLQIPNDEAAQIFSTWNDGELQSFLIEITATVLRRRDDETGALLVDLISDEAKSKGTGKWTSQDAMDLGIPVPTIDAAVSAREISALKLQRVEAEILYRHASPSVGVRLKLPEIEAALSAATMLTYAQGLALISSAAVEYGYGTDLATVARIWRAGCIIRSRTLETIRLEYEANPRLEHLLLSPTVALQMDLWMPSLRNVVSEAARAGTPVPAYAASLAYFDSYRSERLPANLIQAQRDLFGAHTYERVDAGGTFHTEWEKD